MAESVLSFVVETLGTLLTEKIVFLRGVEKQVQKLKDELMRMKCFLKDADQKQDEDARIRHWVSEMRDVSYDAEDVIELFIDKIEAIKNKSFHKRLAYFPIKIHRLYKVGKDIQSIQSKIGDIEASRVKYGIKNLGEGTHDRAEELQILRQTFAHSEDKNTVGIEEKVELLVSQLLEEDTSRRVVSITGMGGVGKTTLARRIYNHHEVQKAFSFHAWVCVSERYNFREIMKTIIKQVESVTADLLDRLEKMEDRDLEQMLFELLQGKRYLVVLDDIWQEEGWDILSRVFPDEGLGNRVLLTSRKKSVALHADPISSPYELQTLSSDESWLLFCKTAFPDGFCAPNLEELGAKIVSHCGGLPLAIATIGSLLLQKKGSRMEWERVLDSISSHVLN